MSAGWQIAVACVALALYAWAAVVIQRKHDRWVHEMVQLRWQRECREKERVMKREDTYIVENVPMWTYLYEADAAGTCTPEWKMLRLDAGKLVVADLCNPPQKCERCGSGMHRMIRGRKAVWECNNNECNGRLR